MFLGIPNGSEGDIRSSCAEFRGNHTNVWPNYIGDNGGRGIFPVTDMVTQQQEEKEQ